MSRPRVLLVAFHYHPEVSAGVHRARIMEEYLVAQGCEVTLLTHQDIKQSLQGGAVVRVPLPRYLAPPEGRADRVPTRRGNLFRRWVRRWLLIPDVFVGWSLLAARAAARRYRQSPFDLVVTSSPPESVHWIGWSVKRRFGVRWLADFRDGWTLEPHREEVRLPARRWLDRRLERAVVQTTDWVTVNTRPVAEDLLTRAPAKGGRIHVLPTGFGDDRFAPIAHDARQFRLVYTGRFGLSWREASPAPFFQGLRQALASDCDLAGQLRLVLKGSFAPEERALWQSPSVAAVVEELPQGPYAEAMGYAAGATGLLLVAPRGLRSVVPRKLFDYLAVRRPILAVADPASEVARILRETRAGVCCAHGDPAGIASELARLFRLWKSGRLDEEIPCSGSDAYRAEPHFARVLGARVLKELAA